MSFYLEKKLGLRVNIPQAFQIAHEQSELGVEQTTPNPCVGCVILDDKDAILGMGYHKKYGGDHAEIEAIKSVTSTFPKSEDNSMTTLAPGAEALDMRFNMATVFVTLEPCAHEGKTPSCAKKLATLPISKVIYLLKDPNEKVSGQGHEILVDAGIKTYCVEDILNRRSWRLKFKNFIQKKIGGTKSSETQDKDPVVQLIYKYRSSLKKIIKKQKYLNRHFLYAMTSDIPYVSLKWAQTLDGVIGLKDRRLLITNTEVQKEVHHLRAKHDFVVVGKNTVLRDNPLLNNRHGSSKNKLNRIAILDPFLEVFEKRDELKIFEVHKKNNLLFVTSEKSDTSKLQDHDFPFIKVPLQKIEKTVDKSTEVIVEELEDKLNLKEALILIKKTYGINSVLVEGGAEVTTSFLNDNLYNELYVFFAPFITFKKVAVRINYLKWLKPLVLNLKSLRLRIFETNFLIQFRK